jgi:hypothetical protein
MKTPVRVGTHIEGVHWVAEYFENTREIRVFREGQEVETFDAPASMFGEEREAGSASDAAHRAEDAAPLRCRRRARRVSGRKPMPMPIPGPGEARPDAGGLQPCTAPSSSRKMRSARWNAEFAAGTPQ